MTVYGGIKKFYNKRSAALIPPFLCSLPPAPGADTALFQLSAALAARLFAVRFCRGGGFPVPIAAEFSKKVLPALAFYVQICYNFCNGVLL